MPDAMPSSAEPTGTEWTVSRNVVDEADAYGAAVGGIEIRAVRTGRGFTSNRVLSVGADRFTLTSCDIGFPVRTTMALGDDRIILAFVSRTCAPQGSRWCDIDLEPGAAIAYGPGAEHAAVNLPGLGFSFVVTGTEELGEVTDRLELDLALPPPGQVHALTRGTHTPRAAAAMHRLSAAAAWGMDGLDRAAHDVLPAMALALTDDARVRRIGAASAIDSRHVVHVCIEYAEATQQIPTITELCIAAHVSERRLREAFVAEFDQPPTLFFRSWALQIAHQRLMASDANQHTVTEIAADIGFGHLGRFAAYYGRVFAESPSHTLRRAQRSVI